MWEFSGLACRHMSKSETLGEPLKNETPPGALGEPLKNDPYPADPLGEPLKNEPPPGPVGQTSTKPNPGLLGEPLKKKSEPIIKHSKKSTGSQKQAQLGEPVSKRGLADQYQAPAGRVQCLKIQNPSRPVGRTSTQPNSTMGEAVLKNRQPSPKPVGRARWASQCLKNLNP